MYLKSKIKLNKMNLQDINFTKYNSEKINKEIGNQLLIVLDEILKYKNELKIVSIILIGGFGRSEGSVIVEDDKIKPLNDYDLFIVIKKLTNPIHYFRICALLSKHSKIIQAKIDIHTDLMPLFYEDIKTLPPLIINYEMKYGSKVLWGENIIEQIPDYSPNDILLRDGVTLLFNRMLSLIYGYPKEKNKKFVILQSLKGLYACCESLLLLSGNYHYSYEERNKRFKIIFPKKFTELYQKFPELITYVDKATNFKLRPDYNIFGDPEQLWKKTVEMYLDVFKHYLITYYNAPSDSSISDIINIFLSNEKKISIENFICQVEYIYNMKIRGKKPKLNLSLYHKPKHFVYASEPFVLIGLYEKKENSEYLESATKYLNKIISIENKNISELREKCIIAWGNGEYEP